MYSDLGCATIVNAHSGTERNLKEHTLLQTIKQKSINCLGQVAPQKLATGTKQHLELVFEMARFTH